MANQAFDPERMSALDAPGSDALWEYIQSGEYADFTAEWYADALAMGMIADDDRSDGQVYSEIGFRAASLGDIEAAGGLSYCRQFRKESNGGIQTVNRPDKCKLCHNIKNQVKFEECLQRCGNLGPQNDVVLNFDDMKVHCKQLNTKMDRRKRACTTFLMYVIYNPRYPTLVKPVTREQIIKGRYCIKVTKLRNPWIYCEKDCSSVVRQDTVNKHGVTLMTAAENLAQCESRFEMCNRYLDTYWANTNPNGKWQDRAGIPCKELPKQFTSAPPSNHPVNDELRCGPVVCDWIPKSEQPWCPKE